MKNAYVFKEIAATLKKTAGTPVVPVTDQHIVLYTPQLNRVDEVLLYRESGELYVLTEKDFSTHAKEDRLDLQQLLHLVSLHDNTVYVGQFERMSPSDDLQLQKHGVHIVNVSLVEDKGFSGGQKRFQVSLQKG